MIAPGALLTRRALFLSVAVAAAERSEAFDLRLQGDRLRVAAPKFSFVTGRPLQRLRDGAPVPFAVQFSVFTDRTSGPLVRDIQRFVVSYDLWEEKFAVTRLGPGRKTASHSTAAATEAWCLDEMALDASRLPERQQFWARLEVRAEDPRIDSGHNGDPMSLARLIDLFSRGAGREEKRWNVEAGPFRLADLRNSGAPRSAPRSAP
jgi:hypothetical protein